MAYALKPSSQGGRKNGKEPNKNQIKDYQLVFRIATAALHCHAGNCLG
jgi:hypothetical protein